MKRQERDRRLDAATKRLAKAEERHARALKAARTAEAEHIREARNIDWLRQMPVGGDPPATDEDGAA